jgi:hypothetical protein
MEGTDVFGVARMHRFESVAAGKGKSQQVRSRLMTIALSGVGSERNSTTLHTTEIAPVSHRAAEIE